MQNVKKDPSAMLRWRRSLRGNMPFSPAWYCEKINRTVRTPARVRSVTVRAFPQS